MIYLTNLLVFAGVIGESIFAQRPNATEVDDDQAKEEEEDEDEESGSPEDFWVFVTVAGLFTFAIASLFSAFVGLAIFKASLGAF